MFDDKDPFRKWKRNTDKNDPLRPWKKNMSSNTTGSDPFERFKKKDEYDKFGRKQRNPLDRSTFPEPEDLEEMEKRKAEEREKRYTIYEPKKLRQRLNVPRKLRKRPKPINAFLWIDDTPYKVVEFSFGFKRHTDGAGRIVGKMQIAPFTVVIKPIRDHGRVVRMAWSSLGTFDGKLEHLKPDGITRIQKDIILHNTYIVGYKDTNWYYEGPPERVVVLQLSPLYMKVHDVVYESTMNPSRPLDWNPPGLLSRESFEEEESEGAVREIYFEDAQGTKIERLSPDMDVVLVLKTTDMAGKTMQGDLSSYPVNFKYQGNPLSNGILENIAISGAITKIELTTIEK